MFNLACVPPEISTSVCKRELAAVGIPVLPIKPWGEVLAEVIGVLQFEDQLVVFERNWYYWVVRCRRPVPRGQRNGRLDVFNRDFGNSVRIGGMSGGDDLKEDVSSWHVDTKDGLNELVKLLREFYGESRPEPKLEGSDRRMIEHRLFAPDLGLKLHDRNMFVEYGIVVKSGDDHVYFGWGVFGNMQSRLPILHITKDDEGYEGQHDERGVLPFTIAQLKRHADMVEKVLEYRLAGNVKLSESTCPPCSMRGLVGLSDESCYRYTAYPQWTTVFFGDADVLPSMESFKRWREEIGV